MLAAFLERKNYEGIRAAMRGNPAYREGKGNVLLFPGESLYTANITDVVKVPLDIKLDVRDGQGKPYEIDRACLERPN